MGVILFMEVRLKRKKLKYDAWIFISSFMIEHDFKHDYIEVIIYYFCNIKWRLEFKLMVIVVDLNIKELRS